MQGGKVMSGCGRSGCAATGIARVACLGLLILAMGSAVWAQMELTGQIGGVGHGLDVQGNYAYAGGDNSFRVLDVSDPTQPLVLGQILLPGLAADVVVSGTLAYVADGYGGLRIIDVANPTTPTVRGFYSTVGFANGVDVSGNLAYIVGDLFGLQIVDVSNPTTPTQRGSYDTPGHAYDVHVSGHLAFVADGPSGVQIIDVSDPSSPTLRGFYNTPVMAVGVFVSSSRAYIADYLGGLRILDVSDPTSPTLLGAYDTAGTAIGVFVADGSAYVADGPRGVLIFDVSDPTSPVLRGSYGTGYAEKVFGSGFFSYATCGALGFRILRYVGPGGPAATPSNLVASAVSPSRVDLSWRDNAVNEDGFRVERRTGTAGAWTEITTATANVTTYSDTGLDMDTDYSYRVQAFNAVANSFYSNVAVAHTPLPPPLAARLPWPLYE